MLNRVRHTIAAAIAVLWFVVCGIDLLSTRQPSPEVRTNTTEAAAIAENEQRTAISIQNSPRSPSKETGTPRESDPSQERNAVVNEAFLGLSPTAWSALLTLVLAVVAGIQVRVYVIMHRANAVAQRGWICLDNLWLNFPERDGPPQVSALIGLRNSGQTPVFIDNAKIKLKISDAPMPDHPDYGDRYSLNPPTTLVAGEMSRWRHHFDAGELPFAAGEAVRKGETRLWIYGVVEYRDAFNARHRYGFAREWDWFKYGQGDTKHPGGMFTHVHSPNYSYAD